MKIKLSPTVRKVIEDARVARQKAIEGAAKQHGIDPVKLLAIIDQRDAMFRDALLYGIGPDGKPNPRPANAMDDPDDLDMI